MLRPGSYHNAHRHSCSGCKNSVQRSDEACDNKGESDTQHREGDGESGTPVAVCLRQDIACSNIEQKASKEAQVIRQSKGGNPEEHGEDGTSHRCCCISKQQ